MARSLSSTTPVALRLPGLRIHRIPPAGSPEKARQAPPPGID
ncbi:hypothetical protein ACOTAG_003606 [Klebsiella aerogenes]